MNKLAFCLAMFFGVLRDFFRVDVEELALCGGGLFYKSLEVDMIMSGALQEAELLNLKNLWPRFGSTICGYERKRENLRGENLMVG